MSSLILKKSRLQAEKSAGKTTSQILQETEMLISARFSALNEFSANWSRGRMKDWQDSVRELIEYKVFLIEELKREINAKS